MKSIHRALFVVCLASLIGCASAPPEITYYLLRAEQVEETIPIEAPVRAGIGRVVVAAYLMGSEGVMVETEPGEVRPATQHKWAEPLDAGLRWYVGSEVAAELGYQIGGGLTDRSTWDYIIDISISRMHGTMDGRAVLEASFIVAPKDRGAKPSQGRFSRSIPLPQEGYSGIVEAQRILLSEFADQIGDVLRKRVEARQADTAS
ncbi:MAG: membrane integrity-associated transporter subunit PqiC [Deltaproteobacteria bacterium]|jgi:uncharacterized lipoprotein YmbA|nr:membrane integrity-associated transporter subunit PqiC [Deltaproteobacteria bacterium]MBW2500917.1 membrane integrity-associated transporter subunit PqiC [Deltaproteobacteria bacterium]